MSSSRKPKKDRIVRKPRNTRDRSKETTAKTTTATKAEHSGAVTGRWTVPQLNFDDVANLAALNEVNRTLTLIRSASDQLVDALIKKLVERL